MKGVGRRRPEAPTLDLERIAEPPSPPSRLARVYFDRADGLLKVKTSTGVVVLGGSGGAGALQLVENKDFGSAATSYTFSGLNGDVDEIYLLVYSIRKAVVAGHFVTVRPNGVTTGQEVRGRYDGTGGSAAWNFTDLRIVWNGSVATTDVDAGTAWIDAHTGVHRTVRAAWASGRTAEVYSMSAVGRWTNTADNITSIAVVSDQANGIGAGSYLRLYKLLKT